MVAKKEDRRVGRTRRLLQEALLDLIVEKGYEFVTVQDIIDRADVGRSTFYAHYPDKRRLLLSRLSELEAFLSEQQRSVRARSDESVDRVFGFSRAMFQHAQEYRRVWGAMVGKQGGAVVLQQLQLMLERIVSREIGALVPRGASPAVPTAVVSRYTVNALLGLLTWWLDQGIPYPPDEVDRMFRVLTKPGITAALKPRIGKLIGLKSVPAS